MERGWVKIFSVSERYKAELLVGLLEQNNIPAVAVDKKDSAYLFGEVEIWVPPEKVIAAKAILNKNQTT
ncbi:MAG: hypothetical protein Kow00127_19150 [Bacteroidales bacterium]